VLVGHGDDQIAGHPVLVVRVLTPGLVWAVVAGRGGLDLADAPVDVEALFAEEQQRRRTSGR
jgi:hypothetical protein